MTPERIIALARALLERGGSLESTEGTGPIDDQQLVAAISAHLTSAGDDTETQLEPAAAAVAAAGIAARARESVSKLVGGAAPGTISEADLAGLEAIVMLTGRPPLRYMDGRLEMPDPVGDNQIWRVLVADERAQIESRSASVGLIAREPPGAPVEPLGTGWRLGTNLVVTNRHVAKLLVEDPGKPVKAWRLNPALTSSVDFWAVNNATKRRSFQLSGIAWCAETEWPDLAVLEFTLGADAPPGALPLDWSEASLGRTINPETGPEFQGRQVYVVGHPYRRNGSGPVTQVFGKADGRKRCSPGYVTSIRSEKGIFQHDCSTLGGNSGSCVLAVDEHGVVGIHYGGLNVGADGVGASNAAIAICRLAGTQAGTILSQGRV